MTTVSHNPLDNDIKYLKGIGEKRAALFAVLGIHTIRQLIEFYPRDYRDWRNIVSIKDAPLGENVCLRVRVLSDISGSGTHNGKTVYGTIARDDTEFIGLKFWNNRYVSYSIHSGDTLYVYGKIQNARYGKGLEMTGPEYMQADVPPSFHAVYPQTAGLTSAQISKAVKTALDSCGEFITETLPAEQIKKYKLISLRDALRMIHFPEDMKDVAAARRRLIYEELLTLQLGLLRRGKGEKLTTRCVMKNDYTAEFAARLPFTMTNAQKNAVKECMADMRSENSMCRLLQGDVGSGKTAVAASLIYTAVKNGYQCVLMAPTEVLANQHAKTFSSFLDGTGMNTVLLTGSLTEKQKRLARQSIADGTADVVIGTHAVITNDTVFSKLGLVITDEQHRFGVMQRAALRGKGENPHVLVMSATPIPRTLSLIIFGDLDISVLDEKPAGRQQIKTYAVDSSYRPRIWNFIKKEAAKGNRSYIICPRVEEDETFDSPKKAAEEYYRTLSEGALSDLRLGLLHGKMKPKEKDAVMTAFSSGGLDVLIATTVIEVGIDVPEATIIVIENAESFGLSQLHQLRGRVGRGKVQSHCILISDSDSQTASERLSVMTKTDDGFKVAEADLQQRGPGDFFGSRQSGLPQLRLADLITDSKILTAARKEAEAIIASDPMLRSPSYALLKEKTDRMFTDVS